LPDNINDIQSRLDVFGGGAHKGFGSALFYPYSTPFSNQEAFAQCFMRRDTLHFLCPTHFLSLSFCAKSLCQKKGVKETRRPHLSLGRFDGIHILPRISTTHCGSEAIVLWLEK
jgi:hypothetical protein